MTVLMPPTIHGDGLDDERAILGLIVAGADMWDERLSADLFFSDRHRRVFETCQRLREAGTPIDVHSVARAMSCSEADWRQAGSIVNELAESMGLPDHAWHYVANLVEDWRRRAAYQRSLEYAGRLKDRTAEVDAVELEFGNPGFAPAARPAR